VENEKSVDQSWKEEASKEKEQVNVNEENAACSCADSKDECSAHDHSEFQTDFISYITSMGFQAMIFLGIIPNPITNEMDKNPKQAKFLIDTLIMMREKTKGNLNEQENGLLDSSIYELQMKYVELVGKEEASDK